MNDDFKDCSFALHPKIIFLHNFLPLPHPTPVYYNLFLTNEEKNGEAGKKVVKKEINLKIL